MYAVHLNAEAKEILEKYRIGALPDAAGQHGAHSRSESQPLAGCCPRTKQGPSGHRPWGQIKSVMPYLWIFL